jgi:hypothetical protein
MKMANRTGKTDQAARVKQLILGTKKHYSRGTTNSKSGVRPIR